MQPSVIRCSGEARSGGCHATEGARETGQTDLFRARLDQIVDLQHPLAKLARTIDWGFLEERFGEVYSDGPGQPPLATRLMAGLCVLKHLHDLSDEVLCERWLENPYYQLVCGEEFFQHRLAFERSSLTRWRREQPRQANEVGGRRGERERQPRPT